MTTLNIGGPEGTMAVKVDGVEHLVTEILFPRSGGDVPSRKAYIGEGYPTYDESYKDQRGRLVDISSLQSVRPTQGANAVVAHDKRHTDWLEGPSIEFTDGGFTMYSRFDDERIEWPISWIGSINPVHTEGGVEVEAHSDLGGALDDIGF